MRLLSLMVLHAVALGAAAQGTVYSVQEVTLKAERPYDNPYLEGSVSAEITGPGGVAYRVNGFWDGEKTWRVRFTPTSEGVWRYRTRSADPGLDSRSGTVEVRRGDAPGFVRVDAEHPYHFIRDDGSRYFMLGTTYYEILANARGGGPWLNALRGSARYGINKVRFNVGEGSDGDRGAGYPDATPYLDGDHDRLDPEHFQRLDDVVGRMDELGIVADMILFWNNDRNYGTVEQDERFVRYVLARYAAYPHVIWCLTNEWNYTDKPREYWNRLGRLVREEDPFLAGERGVRPLSIHHQTRIDFQYFDQQWPTTAIIQLGVRNGQRIVADEWSDEAANKSRYVHGDDWGWHGIMYNRGHDMPVINDEYGYFGEPKDRSAGDTVLTREKHRRILWGIYMAGGYASAGDKYLYDDPPGRPYFAANWHEAAEYEDIRNLKTFFTAKGLPYWSLAPMPDAVASGERMYVLGRTGGPYVVYAAAGGRVGLTLPPGRYRTFRFNPATGDEQPWTEVQGGNVVLGLPPGTDTAVRLEAAAPGMSRAAYLYLEAESGEVAPPFAVAGDAEASGGRYVWIPDGESEIEIDVPRNGRYRITGRVRSPGGSDNSVWLRMDDGSWNRWEMTPGAGWHADEVRTRNTGETLWLDLEAGRHWLGLRQREDGTMVDAFALTDDPAYTYGGERNPRYVYLSAEAEAFRLAPPLTVESDRDASGGRYVWMPSGRTTYRFRLDRVAAYVLWGRVRSESGGDDSFKIEMNDFPSQSWNGMEHQPGWHWEIMHDSRGEVLRWELGPGEHTLRIGYREDGARIDRLLITDDPAFHP